MSISIIEKSAVGAGDEGLTYLSESILSSSSCCGSGSDVVRNGEPSTVEKRREKRGSLTVAGGCLTGDTGRDSLLYGSADDDELRW